VAVAPRFDVSIDGREYLVDIERYRRSTVPAQKQQQDTSDDVGEQTLSNVGQWIRSQSDWSRGAGQEHYDLVDSDRRRFHTSKNVDVWTKGHLSICKALESKQAAGTNTNLYARIVNGSVFYFSDGSDMKYGNPDAAPTITFSASAQGGTIKDWTSDGSQIYSCIGTAVKKVAVSSTSGASTIGSFAGDVIEFANGRLISADGARIVELNSSGTVLTFDKTLTGTCIAIKGGPQRIYAAYNVNGQGILYSIGISSTDGALAYPVPAAVLPVGETFSGPFCLDIFGSMVIAGTSAGCRFGVISTQDNASITFGPVVDDGGAAYGTRIVGKYGYWGTSNGDTWKADLTVFNDVLQPAYARFLAHDSDTYGNVLSLEVVNGKLFFTDSNGELYGEDYSGDLSTSAELVVGQVTFGTSASKVARAVSGRFANEQAESGSGDIDYRVSGTDYRTSTLNYRGLTAGVTGTTTITLTDENNVSTAMVLTGTGVETAYSAADPASETFVVKLTLARSSTTTAGPVLERWSLHARPQPSRVEEIIAPLVIQGRVATSHGAGAPVGYDSQDEYLALRTLVTTAKSVTFQEGDRSESVTVEDLQMEPVRYSPDGSFWEGTLICRLLTVP
tara:strand:+ start:3545 stop:5398 length:1854 start_codon:yes stop_codon:yes gene_type:complete